MLHRAAIKLLAVWWLHHFAEEVAFVLIIKIFKTFCDSLFWVSFWMCCVREKDGVGDFYDTYNIAHTNFNAM